MQIQNIKELTVQAEHGIGQEKSAGSLQWTLLYDIILE
jgi:hypothetical protein